MSKQNEIDLKQATSTVDVRELRNNVLLYMQKRGFKSLLISSVEPEMNKTLVSLEVARSFASLGDKVLVIDADILFHKITTALGVLKEPGLVDLIEKHSPEPSGKYIIHLDKEPFDILPSGTSVSDPTKVLSGDDFSALISSLRDKYDLIISDGPASNGDSELPFVAKSVDTVLLVVRQRVTLQKELRDAVEKLKSLDVDILGGVYTIG